MQRLIPLLLLLTGCGDAAPVSASGPAGSSGSVTTEDVRAGGLVFAIPTEWKQLAGGGMRLLEYELAGEGGAEPASVVVFHFKTNSANVQANFERWAEQFEQPEGQSSLDAATTSEERRSGLTIHTMEISGRYRAETTPGSGERVDKPDWQARNAVVDGPGGPWYVKCTGPRVTMERWSASIDALLAGIRP